MPLGSRYTRWRLDLSRGAGEKSKTWSGKEEGRERERYAKLKSDLTRAPDGSYPAEIYDEDSSTTAATTSTAAKTKVPPLEVNNPLSLSDKNPWHSYFASLSMLDQIKVDVQRAFPDDDRLRPEGVQRQLVRILFVWSLVGENEQVGYRQGMHEIAAICWLVRSDVSADADEEGWTEADAFTLFELIMAKARGWFEWRNATKFPISHRCDAIQAMLFSTDARLATHLDGLGVEMQLFAIRWVRLIFTRELPLVMALELWDALFSLDPSLELVDAICVAMLIRIRTQLLDSDYSAAFQALLNYPDYALQCSPLTLVKQAQEIRRLPSQMTLMTLMEENEEMLDMPASLNQDSFAPPTMSASPPSLTHLTKGIYAQSLSAGLNRALYNVQKTVNAAYLSHTVANGPANDGFPPLLDTTKRSANYPPKDASGELDELKQTNRLIGSSLVRVIDVLEKHWSEEVVGKKEEGDRGQATQVEIDFLLSLTTLKHSRDVLLGTTADFDPSVVEGPKAGAKEEDHKAKEFGQRFKRTTDESVPTVKGGKAGAPALVSKGGQSDAPTPASSRGQADAPSSTISSQSRHRLGATAVSPPTPTFQPTSQPASAAYPPPQLSTPPERRERAKVGIEDPLGVA